MTEWINSFLTSMYVCIYVFMYVHVCDVLTCLLIPSVWRFCLSVPMFVRMCVKKELCMYVCMYFVYMSLPQMRHCYIAPHHPLGICHNNIAVDNTFPTCFGGGQVRTLNKWNMNTDTDADIGCKLDFVCMYACMYVYDALTCLLILFVWKFCLSVPIYVLTVGWGSYMYVCMYVVCM